MKVVTAEEMSRIEKCAYQQGFRAEDFMEAAGAAVAQHIVERYPCQSATSQSATSQSATSQSAKVLFLCGKGNNGGDGFVAARYLLRQGISVLVSAFNSFEECSALSQRAQQEFIKGGGEILYLKKLPSASFWGATLLVDALFGTGFKGEVQGIYKEIIEMANESDLPLLSIDIPSGINGTTGEVSNVAIRAHETLFLELPKRGCFVGRAWNYVGHVALLSFGLPPQFVESAEESFILLPQNMYAAMLPKIERRRHKYIAGYVVGIGGSPTMPGAPLLSSLAALRSGAGMVRLFHPQGMEEALAGAPYELIRQGWDMRDHSEITQALKRATGLFVGPGLGKSDALATFLKELFLQIQIPLVIDADALTLIGEQNLNPPQKAILTPHTGEMMRLLQREGEHLEDNALLELCQKYVDERQVTLVLKGAPTYIFAPYATPIVSTRGNPGMATAGSGDVLTGIIAAFLAAKVAPRDAACLGVFLHGLAGDFAAAHKGFYSLIASDIIDHLPDAFNALQGLNHSTK